MKKYNVQQDGGFPLETETLDFQQSAYDIFNALGELAGDKVIIKGCELNGNNVSDGVVYVNGEVFEFRGGTKQDNVIIREEPTAVEFEDGDLKEAYFDRWVEFGVGASQISWSDFTRLDSIRTIIQRIVQLEQRPDNTVAPATQAEVNARQINSKYVSPATLPAQVILLTGAVASNGNKMSHFIKSFSSTRTGTGRYRITHNLGTTNYGLVGAGLNSGVIKVGIQNRAENYCEVWASDDSTPNDASFTFQIFKTA